MNRLKRIIQERQRQRMLNDVTNQIQNPPQGGLKVNPETGVRYEEPLEVKHPSLDIALAVAQPGTIVEKALAPMVYKGMAQSIAEGNVGEALMSGIAPTKIFGLSAKQLVANAEKYHKLGTQTKQLLDDIAVVGIPKEGLGLSRLRNLLSRIGWRSGENFNREMFNKTAKHYRTLAEKIRNAKDEAARIDNKYKIMDNVKMDEFVPHNPKTQAIIESDLTPFDEMVPMSHIGAKARTTADFRMSDYPKSGIRFGDIYKQGGRLKWK